MTKANIIESAEQFLDLLERSQIFAPNQLEAIKKLAESRADPLAIARTLVKKGWLTKWQASQLLSGFCHLTLGKYRLADHLGKGELGNVYLAENPKLGRKVALKTLSKKCTESPELVKRFLDEARAAAALDHRNIVHVHDCSSEGQRHYVVMEYVTGRDLQSRVDAEGALSFAEAADVIRQAAEGLQHAHGQGVVHRDIKPANIMVDDNGVAKILDIGVGHLRRSESNPSDNTAELMMSAIAYMAPEHARGRDVDARCDIYSLGGVLYFLLTARAPFSMKTDGEREKIKESKRPVPVTDLRADTPPALVALCDRMLAPKPEDRFGSMAEVLAALATLGDLGTAATSTGEDANLAAAEPLDIKADESDAEKTEVKSEPKIAAPAVKIDIGDPSKPTVAAAPVDFAINTKKRKKKPAPAGTATVENPAADEKSEPEAAAAAAAGDKPALADAGPQKGLSKGVIIGGACAAGLLLIIGVGVIVVLSFGRGETKVAQAAQSATASADEAASETEAGDAPTDATAGDDAEADGLTAEPPEPAAETEATPAAGTEATAESSANNALAVAAGATEPAAAAGDVAAVTPATPAAATDATAPPAASDAVTTEPTAETPAPEQPAEATPEPKATPEPEKPEPEKPEPEKPEPEKPAPEKPAPPKPKTFAFEPAVDLPTPSADAPELTLGQINVRPQDAVFISLDGGDIAAGGRFRFDVQNAQDGVAPRDWEFYLSDGSSDPVVIATMSLPEKELKFKWTTAGVENTMATNLRNCSLRITAGKDQPQDLALRTPQKIAPIPIEVERSGSAKILLEGAPDKSSLKMEVTVKGHKSMVEPAQVDLGKGGEAVIYFGENQDQAAFALKLSASVNARGIQIKTDPYFIVPIERAPVRLNKGSIKKYEAYQAQQAGLQNRIFEGQQAISGKKLPPQQKAQAEVVLADWKQQLALIDKTVTKLAQLNTDMAAIGSGASLQFRVFSDTFQKQIDLIVTDPNAAPVAP